MKVLSILVVSFLLFACSQEKVSTARLSELNALIKNATDLKEEWTQRSQGAGSYVRYRWFKDTERGRILVATAIAQYYEKPKGEEYAVIINCYIDRKLTDTCLSDSDYYGSLIVEAIFNTLLKDEKVEKDKARQTIRTIKECGRTECRSVNIDYGSWAIYVSSMGKPIEWVKITAMPSSK